MASIVLNGPVIRDGEHNLVLRDALFHSPEDRYYTDGDYHTVEVGIREGQYTSWIGTWGGSRQYAQGGVPISILNDGRNDMRLKANQVIVIRVTCVGVPGTIEGAKVNFRLGRVGGRDGPVKPLVDAGSSVGDANSRVAVAALERQVNTGGLSNWEDSVQLHDPVVLAATAAFHGRLQIDDSVTMSLQRYIGNWVEVDGTPVAITSDGRTCTTSDGLVNSQGGETTTTPAGDLLYSVYLNRDGRLRMSLTSPSSYLGAYYLGTGLQEREWRFCGWAYLDSATQFNDSETVRLLCNYYNRVVKDLFLCPAYADDDAQTVYTETAVIWSRANSGNGSKIEFLSNAEDAAVLHGTASVYNSGNNTTELGIGVDDVTTPLRVGIHGGTTTGNIAIHYSDVLAVGYHRADLLVRVSAGTGTYIADDERYGGTADPPVTYISGQVLV